MESNVGHLAVHQSGERGRSLSDAFARAAAAADELGMTFELTPGLDASPGMWECVLRKPGRTLSRAHGLGKGDRDVARAGALFEALEHQLSGLDCLDDATVSLRPVSDIVSGPLARDVAVGMLAEGSAGSLACWSFRAMAGAATLDVPIFLSLPEYVEDAGDPVRERLGDRYDYVHVGRYACNSGWAAGCDPVDATVHALNEAIERDSLSLLLTEQFIHRGRPLRLIDPATLPTEPADLLARAEEVARTPVHLVDMTTDIGVPSILAFVAPPTGAPARIRGCGASLSMEYAITRSLTELVQARVCYDKDEPSTQVDQTIGYPTLHACRRADLTPLLPGAALVPFIATPAPETPAGHRDRLVELLSDRGYTPYLREHYVSGNIAVVNVTVPGLERFMLITDGILVVPGQRGRAH